MDNILLRFIASRRLTELEKNIISSSYEKTLHRLSTTEPSAIRENESRIKEALEKDYKYNKGESGPEFSNIVSILCGHSNDEIVTPEILSMSWGEELAFVKFYNLKYTHGL